jgi:hypothetical protein
MATIDLPDEGIDDVRITVRSGVSDNFEDGLLFRQGL